MIELKNVSKYYHNKGAIAAGMSGVSLRLEPGEFVVITGESGSGKTTLLNVISGLDSYEEGEMYIDGRETSHYMAADFEDYRKKYIGSVFQDFNLVNSYTVAQNVELALRINGRGGKSARAEVREIIDRVGLSDFANTRASKLSGGQMQKTAIARALAGDTEIIAADEPTGNLDSKSAREVAKLLGEISGDKLVIVVTHDFDIFRDQATRLVRMHDGRVVENLKLRETDVPRREAAENATASKGSGRMTAAGKLRLGLRNTFNVGYKFALLLIVFLFLVFAVTSQYTSYLNQKAENDALGYNSYFYNYSDQRIVLKKKDGSRFTDKDLRAIGNVAGIERVSPNDILLDSALYIEDGSFSYEAFPMSVDEFEGKLHEGRLPERGNEVLLVGQRDDYNFSAEKTGDLIGRTYSIYTGTDEDSALKVRITGIAFDRNTDEYETVGKAYMTDEFLSKMLTETYYNYSTITTVINGKAQECTAGDPYYRPLPSDKIREGEALLPAEADNFYEEGGARGHEVEISAENLCYNKTVKLRVSDVYTAKNFSAKSGRKRYDKYGGAVFISKADYDSLFSGGNYQCSAYAGEAEAVDEAADNLKAMGYTALPLKDAKVKTGSDLLSMIQIPLIIIIMIALLFIAYFVIRLILRSRTKYFAILRMLGLAKKSIRRILDIELFTVLNIAFALFIAVILLANSHLLDAGCVNMEYIATLVEYMKFHDYVILYAILVIMSWLISGKFAAKLFRKTAIGSYREEDSW